MTLLLVDLAARPFLKDMLYYRPEERFKNRWPPFPALSRFDSNVDFSSEVIGDISAISGLSETAEPRFINFRTDEFGYRNDTWDRESPLDVLILGDSFGEGVGVTQEKTWNSVLSGKYGLNVYNLSMPGYNLWHELLCFKIEQPRLLTNNRTLVIWAVFAGNDLDTPYGKILFPEMEQSTFRRFKVTLSTYKRRSPFIQLFERIRFGNLELAKEKAIARKTPDGEFFLFYSEYVMPVLRPIEEVRRHDNYEIMRSVIMEMADFLKRNDLDIAIMVIPDKSEVYRWILDGTDPREITAATSGFSAALREICETEGIRFLDLNPGFSHKAKELYEESGELLWWRDDTHWNENGHSLAAELVYEYLLSGK